MNFHQFQLAYNVVEDRILMRVSFRPNASDAYIPDAPALHEVRAMLSRRMVRNLWPNVVKAMETRVALDQPEAAHVKSDIIGMEHQASLDAIGGVGGFNQPYDDASVEFPLGTSPILISRAEFTVTRNQPLRINFQNDAGKGFEISFEPRILYGFCTMLQTTVAKAEWAIDLELPGIGPTGDGERVLN